MVGSVFIYFDKTYMRVYNPITSVYDYKALDTIFFNASNPIFYKLFKFNDGD